MGSTMLGPVKIGFRICIAIELKYFNYLDNAMEKKTQSAGIKDGKYFSCHAQNYLISIRVMSGSYPTTYLGKDHNMNFHS